MGGRLMVAIIWCAGLMVTPICLSAQSTADPQLDVAGFKPISDLQLEMDGLVVEDAEIYYQPNSEKILIAATKLEGAVLLNPRTRTVERIDSDELVKNADGSVNISGEWRAVIIGEFREGFNSTMAIERVFEVSGFSMKLAPSTRPLTVVTSKLYPWDTRPSVCSHPDAEGHPMCDQKIWRTVRDSQMDLESLFREADFELIGKAEQDLGFSNDRLDDGEYRAALWMKAMRDYFVYQFNRQELAERWEGELGADSFACYARAMIAFGDAITARGTGYANAVTDQSMRIYISKLEEADKLLDLCPDSVQRSLPWHSSRVAIGYMLPSLKGRREERFAAAVAAWPDATQTYIPAMNYSQPVWGGSFEELERLARVAVAASHERLKTTLYARLYNDIFSNNANYNIAKSNANWDDLKASFRDVEALGKYPEDVPSGFARLACAMGDRAEARYLFEWSEKVIEKVYGSVTRDAGDVCVRFAFSEG